VQKSPCCGIELNELPCKVARNIRSVTLASFGSLMKRYLQWLHRQPHNDQLYAAAAANKHDVMTKRLHTRMTLSQSLTASVSESQVVCNTLN